MCEPAGVVVSAMTEAYGLPVTLCQRDSVDIDLHDIAKLAYRRLGTI